jgi:hypothetical protein
VRGWELRQDGVVHLWRRRLSDNERSVLLSELLLRHPELAAEAEEITTTLLVVENEQELADEITACLRALRPGPISADAGRELVLDLLQPYIDDITRRRERGASRAAADVAVAVLLGLYECRDDMDQDMLLVQLGLPGAADDLARNVYTNLEPLRLMWPGLADECPEWQWYQERLEEQPDRLAAISRPNLRPTLAHRQRFIDPARLPARTAGDRISPDQADPAGLRARAGSG